MKTIFSIFLAIFLVSCATKQNYEEKTFQIGESKAQEFAINYKTKILSAFTTPISDDIKWFETLVKKQGYAANLQPYTQDELDDFLKNANFKDLAKINKNAIITQSTELRLMPTFLPRFANPNEVGEGYPFDYFQSTYLYSQTPVKVSHLSLDGAFYFVQSAFASGFVKKDAVKFVNEDEEQLLKDLDLVFAKEDKILLKKGDELIEIARIGMPLFVQNDKIKIFKNDKIFEFDLDDRFQKLGTPFTQDDVKTLAYKLKDTKYGWGGFGALRDCSMLTRDIWGSFGVFLPRNSQAQVQNSTDISKLSNQEKLDFIAKNGIPFATLIGLKGHVMLYAGVMDGKVMVYHLMWGLKVRKDGKEMRKIIGKTALTPLEIGKGIVRKKDLILTRVNFMKNLF